MMRVTRIRSFCFYFLILTTFLLPLPVVSQDNPLLSEEIRRVIDTEGAEAGKVVRNYETFEGVASTLGFDPRESGSSAGPTFHVYPDGALLVLFRYPNAGILSLWRRALNGTWSSVGDLNSTALWGPEVAVHPNGDIFVTSHRCVWRLREEIEAVAGECVGGEAPYGFPTAPSLTISPNGRVFASDFHKIYEVFPDERRAELFAGCEGCEPAVIGESARDRDLGGAGIIAASRRGIYLTARDSDTIGFIDWAGRYDLAYAGADSSAIRRLELDSDDALHFMVIEGLTGAFIKRLQADGTAATVAGASRADLLAQGADLSAALRADGVPATSILLAVVNDIGFDASGRLFYSTVGPADDTESIIPLIKIVENAYGDSISADELIIPSRRGDKMYVFDRQGRILETRHALTDAAIYSFEH